MLLVGEDVLPASSIRRLLWMRLHGGDGERSLIVLMGDDRLLVFSRRLRYLFQQSIVGGIVDLGLVLMPSTSRADRLCVSFPGNRVCLLECINYAFVNVQLHHLSAVNTPVLADADSFSSSPDRWSPGQLSADPGGRCVVVRLDDCHLGFLPVHAIIDSRDKPKNVISSEGEEEGWPSFAVSLAKMDERFKFVEDAQLVPGYLEPTVALMGRARPAPLGRLSSPKDAVWFALASVDLRRQTATTIHFVDCLPSDLMGMVVVPRAQPVGGCLLVGPNSLVHVEAGSPTGVGLALNSWCPRLSAFPYTVLLDDLQLPDGPSGVHCLNAEDTFALSSGHLLTLRKTGRFVSGLDVIPEPNVAFSDGCFAVDGDLFVRLHGDRLFTIGSDHTIDNGDIVVDGDMIVDDGSTIVDGDNTSASAAPIGKNAKDGEGPKADALEDTDAYLRELVALEHEPTGVGRGGRTGQSARGSATARGAFFLGAWHPWLPVVGQHPMHMALKLQANDPDDEAGGHNRTHGTTSSTHGSGYGTSDNYGGGGEDGGLYVATDDGRIVHVPKRLPLRMTASFGVPECEQVCTVLCSKGCRAVGGAKSTPKDNDDHGYDNVIDDDDINQEEDALLFVSSPTSTLVLRKTRERILEVDASGLRVETPTRQVLRCRRLGLLLQCTDDAVYVVDERDLSLRHTLTAPSSSSSASTLIKVDYSEADDGGFVGLLDSAHALHLYRVTPGASQLLCRRDRVAAFALFARDLFLVTTHRDDNREHNYHEHNYGNHGGCWLHAYDLRQSESWTSWQPWFSNGNIASLPAYMAHRPQSSDTGGDRDLQVEGTTTTTAAASWTVLDVAVVEDCLFVLSGHGRLQVYRWVPERSYFRSVHVLSCLEATVDRIGHLSARIVRLGSLLLDTGTFASIECSAALIPHALHTTDPRRMPRDFVAVDASTHVVSLLSLGLPAHLQLRADLLLGKFIAHFALPIGPASDYYSSKPASTFTSTCIPACTTTSSMSAPSTSAIPPISTCPSLSHVVVHPLTGCLVVAQRVQVAWQLPTDEYSAISDQMDANVPERPLLPTAYQYRLVLLSPMTLREIDSFADWRPYETVTDVQMANLDTKQTASGRKPFVAVGTAWNRGEDRPGRGRLLAFDVVSVVPEAARPDRAFKLKLLAAPEVKGSVTALGAVEGCLVGALGGKSFLHSLDDDADLEACGVFDNGVCALSVAAVKNFLAVGDAMLGLSFWAFQKEPPKLVLLGRDLSVPSGSLREMRAVGFVHARRQLLIVGADYRNRALHFYAYAPLDRRTGNGQRLLCRGALFLHHPPLQLLPTCRGGLMALLENGQVLLLSPLLSHSASKANGSRDSNGRDFKTDRSVNDGEVEMEEDWFRTMLTLQARLQTAMLLPPAGCPAPSSSATMAAGGPRILGQGRDLPAATYGTIVHLDRIIRQVSLLSLPQIQRLVHLWALDIPSSLLHGHRNRHRK